MSAAKRCRSCACCGSPLTENDPVSVEPMLDGPIRYVAVLWGHTTFSPVEVRDERGADQVSR